MAAAAAVVVGFSLFVRASGAKPIPDAALRAAVAARCGDVQAPESDPQGGHLQPEQTYRYPDEPATSGPHDPSPLQSEPQVYTSPIPETRAVHNLEHAYALIYYRSEGTDALAKPVVQELESLANAETKVIMAPHPSLPPGTGLAVTAWNKLWECPATVSLQQARTIAAGFIQAYRGTGNAPEPAAP